MKSHTKMCDKCGKRKSTCFIYEKNNVIKESLCIECYRTPEVVRNK